MDILFLQNDRTSSCPQVKTISQGRALAQGRHNVPRYNRVLQASAIPRVERSPRFTIGNTFLRWA